MVAYINDNDAYHEASANLIDNYDGALRIPALVIAEVAYLVNTRLGIDVEVGFLRGLSVGGFSVEALVPADWQRIADLVDRYRNLSGDSLQGAAADGTFKATGLGTVDASVVATAERLGITDIASLDNDYRCVSPEHVKYFNVVPQG